MSRRSVRTVLTATAAIVALGTAPAVAHTAVHPTGGPTDRTGPVWGDCPKELAAHPRQKCAELRMPLDHRHPRGRHVTVRVSRIPAADPARRLGTLVLLPGGPGLGGLDWPADFADGPPELRDRYDLVGFDARGIRYSSPVTCGLEPADIDGLRYPAPDGSIAASVIAARRIADKCRRHGGTTIRHITTANTARDLDRIRAALGERRISLYGLSYGTYLGAAYASMFPDRTDRVVLDAAIDPRRAWYDFVRLGGQGIAERLPDLTAWVAARHDTYGFGTTPEQVHRRYRDLTSALDTMPAGDIDGNRLRDETYLALKEPADTAFAWIAGRWAAAAGKAVTPPAGPAKATTPPDDNAMAVQYAVHCGDVAWPRDVRSYAEAVRVDRLRFPDDAGRAANITPCAFWPAPVESPVRVTDRGPRNILVVHNRRDPSTPWVSGLGMRRAFGDRAALVTADFGGHGTVGYQKCGTVVALEYLAADLPRLPEDRTCPS